MADRFRLGGLGYGQAKQELFECLNDLFREPRERYEGLMANREEIDRILLAGAEKVRERGSRILAQVREAVGARKYAPI
jgi:tryptophanyl-tRNA synthetase